VLGLLLTPSPSVQTKAQSDSQKGSQTGSQTDKQKDTGTQTGRQSGTEMETKGGAKAAAMTPTEFLKDAMMANMTEIRLGQLAQQRASSSQVKQFAQQMIDAHTKANEQVQKVAQQKGVQAPADLDKKHTKVEEQLSQLQGAAFDRAYMDMMVKDHRADVAKFAAQSKSSKDEDVRNLATTLLPNLQQHLQMATDTRAQVGPGRAE